MASFYQRESGYWQAIVRRKGYPQQSRTFPKKPDAVTWARDIENQIDRGILVDRAEAEKHTLWSVLDRYKKQVSPLKRSGGLEKLRITAIQGETFTKTKMAALTAQQLADYRDARLKAVSGSTVNRELNIISAAINHARREWGIRCENPVALLRRPQENKARNRRLEPGEEKKLLDELEAEDGGRDAQGRLTTGTRNPWVKPLVQLALETAMRRGELLALDWKHVDIKRRRVHLPHTKNGQARDVPLSKAACALLEGLPRSIDGRVFPTTAAALKKAFSRACERAGIEDFHFHDLRHEATSRLALKLPNVIELAAVTGHKDLRMLSRYYHPRVEDLAKKLG